MVVVEKFEPGHLGGGRMHTWMEDSLHAMEKYQKG